MNINYCIKQCPCLPNHDCRLNAIKNITSFFNESNLNKIVQKIKREVCISNNFTLKLKNFQCLDNGFSGQYDILFNDTVIDQITFMHPDLCLHYCVIYFLNELKLSIENDGFICENVPVLNPYSKICFTRKIA